MGEGEHSCTAGNRFDRIESWLEKLAVQMEKVTELLVETRINRKTLDDHETRIRVLEKVQSSNAILIRWVERFLWAMVAGAIWYFTHN